MFSFADAIVKKKRIEVYNNDLFQMLVESLHR